MSELTSADRIAGGIWGLLVGDALGVPYEFHPADEIPPADQIEMEPPEGFLRAHAGTPPGTWSDDGAHALCLLASLLYVGRLDPEDLARRLTNWYEHGYLAVDGRVFDVGVQTGRALLAFRAGVPAVEAGPHRENENGNGSLMRVLPLALWHRGTDAELVADARLQSRVTHGHVRSQLCCALYCLWARRILVGQATDAAWHDATAVLREITSGDDAATGELEMNIRPDEAPAGRGSGYVVDCLRSARLAIAAGPYERAVKAAILFGNDTDTTACVAGGIAGIRDGAGAIPGRWLEALRDRELAEPLLERLLDRSR
jgi:ADP-ribosylglycohydrolase